MARRSAIMLIAVLLLSASTAAWAESGERKLGIILALTKDGKVKYEPPVFWDLFFKQGLSGKTPDGVEWHGSLRDYWSDCSRGKMTLIGDVTPYVQLDVNGADIPKNDQDLGHVIFEAAKAQVKELYRGGPQPEPGTFDPKNYHQIYMVLEGPMWVHGRASGADGMGVVYVHASWGAGGAGKHLLDLGLLAHEYGHTQDGLPDFYGGTFGHIGLWEIMGDGLHGETPVGAFGYTRWRKGWLTPIDVAAEETVSVRARPLWNYDDVYEFDEGIPGDPCFFIVENRQKIGRDAILKRGGLTIYYHQQDGYSLSYDRGHGLRNQYMRMVRADNDDTWGYGPPGDEGGDAYPGLNGENALTIATFPGSPRYNGEVWWEFDNIRQEGDDILFDAHYRGIDLLEKGTATGAEARSDVVVEENRKFPKVYAVAPGKAARLTANLDVTAERRKVIIAVGFENDAKEGEAEASLTAQSGSAKPLLLGSVKASTDGRIDVIFGDLDSLIGKKATLTLEVKVPQASKAPAVIAFARMPYMVPAVAHLIDGAPQGAWRVGESPLAFGKDEAGKNFVGFAENQAMIGGRVYGPKVLTTRFAPLEMKPMVGVFKNITIPKHGAFRATVGRLKDGAGSASMMVTFSNERTFFVVTKDWIPVTRDRLTEIDQPLDTIAGMTGDLSIVIKPDPSTTDNIIGWTEVAVYER